MINILFYTKNYLFNLDKIILINKYFSFSFYIIIEFIKNYRFNFNIFNKLINNLCFKIHKLNFQINNLQKKSKILFCTVSIYREKSISLIKFFLQIAINYNFSYNLALIKKFLNLIKHMNWN